MDIRPLDDALSASPQIALQDLAAVAAQGFRSVISNRPDGEDPDQPSAAEFRQAAEAVGLAFAHVPVVGGAISDADVAAFRRTLESTGAKVEKLIAFPDHHRYVPLEVRRLIAEAQEFMAEALVTTEKDAAKLDPDAFALPLVALRVEIEITRGDDRLEAKLQELVQDLVPAATAPTTS